MTRAPIAAFIFDIDGTIIDSMPYHNRSWNLLFERHGIGAEHLKLAHRGAGRTGVELTTSDPDHDFAGHAHVIHVCSDYRSKADYELVELLRRHNFA